MRAPPLALLALLALPALAQGHAPLPLPWTITGQEHVEGGFLVLTADVTIAPGGALRLRSVEVLAAGTLARPLTIAVQAGGLLDLSDVRLVSPGGPLDLVVHPGASLVVHGSNLTGVRPRLAGSAAIAGSDLALTQGPLRVQGTTTIAASTLRDSPTALLRVEAGSLVVQDSTLRNSQGTGAWVEAGASLALRDATVEAVGAYAVDAREAALLVVERTHFRNSSEYALHVTGTPVLLRGNTFEVHCAAFLSDGTTGLFEGNVVAVTGRGLTLNEAPVAVANNTFRGGERGLHVLGAAPLVEGNTFTNLSLAAHLEDSAAMVRTNTFHANDAGVDALPGAGGALPTLRGNSFLAHAAFAVRNQAPAAGDASGNWWGSPSGPSAGQAEGPWVVSPWLAAAP